MAKYSIEGTTLTAVANGVRGLVAAGTMTPDGMATNLQSAADEVSDQAELIEQISTLLAEKATPAIPEPEPVVPLTATTKPNSNSTSIAFTGLTAEPKMFAISPTSNITLGSTRYVTGVMYDGAKTHGTYGYRSGSSATSYYSASYFTWTYSNGTLTVKTSSSSNGGNFTSSTTYQLTYVK